MTCGNVALWPIATNSSFGPDVSFWGEAEVSGRQSSLPRSKLTLSGPATPPAGAATKLARVVGCNEKQLAGSHSCRLERRAERNSVRAFSSRTENAWKTMISRRTMIASGVAALAGSAPLSRTVGAAERPFLPPGLPEGVYDTATFEALPGKKPLIKLSYRPPNYETPLSHFTSEFTPNESFFVRYHLAGIPDEFDAALWKLKVGGDGAGQ